MRYISGLILLCGLAAAGCTTTANNANIRGTNTNTGYMTNSETNARPTIPANMTNVAPPNVNYNSNHGNYGVNHNSSFNTNAKITSVTNTNSNANNKRP